MLGTISLIFHILGCSTEVISPDSPWRSIGNRKLIKIMSAYGSTNYHAAKALCSAQGQNVSLLEIGTAEQEIVVYLLKELSSINQVRDFWLKRNIPPSPTPRIEVLTHFQANNTFQANKSKTEEMKGCKVIKFNEENQNGLELPVSCNEKAEIVCQQRNEPPSSIEVMESELIGLQLKYYRIVDRVSRLEKAVDPPVGLIYTQLPGQLEPSLLWPHCRLCQWNDTSNAYAGNFFRVVGGDSAPFGSSQGDQTRKLVNVRSSQNGAGENNPTAVSADGSWSPFIWSGQENGLPRNIFLSFQSSPGEVRPKNQAVKIWKRVA